MEKIVLTENMEYQAPEVEIVEVAIERGFEASTENYRVEPTEW